MNKLIFTNNRLFMAVVGPSGSGKTQLLFDMLLNQTFYPDFEKIYFFYKEYQPLYDQMKRRFFNLEFVPCMNFDLINTLENCLLIFDDTCEEVYENPSFLKLATSGRHKKVSVIVVKHNLFHQSKLSRTIDLNTTHIIIFKSPRDVSQIAHFGRQLNKSKFLKDAYEKATESEPYGHLLIDLDPKTSDCLRYCSNLIGPMPSVFYLPSSKAVETILTNEREKAAYATRIV